MLTKYILCFLMVFSSFLVSAPAWAQTEELDVIELELENDKAKSVNTKSEFSEPVNTPPKNNKLSDFSDLSTLNPFREISIIQKRFMPKTGRFQLFGGGTIITNDPFFQTFGGVAKAGYFLTEQWGLELNYFSLTTSTRQGTNDLKDIQGVTTENLVYPQSYMGADIVFVPIYGKMTWFNEKIVPFDIYFSAGYGTTAIQSGENAGTLHLATGQLFALGKSYAFRWDFSWNFYNAKGVKGESNAFNNLFLTVGMSWFFPEASYR